MTLWPAPPAAPLLLPGEVQLWRFPLATAGVALSVLKSLLSPDELQRAGRLLDAQKAQAFIVGRGRLRQILAAYRQCDPAAIAFSYGGDGKPALPPSSPLHFNLSHSGAWAVLALSRGGEVGVDIERIDPCLDYEGLAARFFSGAEQKRLLAAPWPRRRRSFYRLWTRKEALLKGQGRGFSGGVVAREGWKLRPFWLGPGYVGAIACAGEMPALRRFSWSE
jgi:4'-phosphopantetheinyl transferase